MKKVCIIGAGISGISAAENLISKGYSVDIYEQSPEIGGRISALKDAKTNEFIDNGQHLLVGAYRRFLYLINKFKTEEYLKYQKSIKIKYINKNNTFDFDTSKLPGILGQLNGILNFNALKIKDKYNLIRFALKIMMNNIKSDLTCKDFLLSENQSFNSIKYFWEPLILATINNEISHSPAQLLINILKDAFFADNKSGALIFPKKDLHSLIQPFEQYIKDNKSNIYKKTKIKEIIIDNQKVKGIKLKNNEIIKYKNVITCIPPYSLIKLIPNTFKNDFEYLNQFNYSPIVSGYFWYDKNPLEEDIYAMIDTNIQWIFNKRNFDKKKYDIPCLLSITISDANHILNLNQKEISKLITDEINSTIPEFKRCKLLHSRVINEKMATFKADLFTEKIRPENITSVKNLFIAGDWTNTGYPATIEGAAISGYKAANLIK